MPFEAGTHPLVVKLRTFLDLNDHEARALTFPGNAHHYAAPGTALINYGQPVIGAVLLEEGWAIRHRTLSDGRSQILGFVLPGDLCDPTAFVEKRAHADVSVIAPARFTYVMAEDVRSLAHRSPQLSAAMWWQSAYEQASTRAHLFALGRFSAYERLAYLLHQLAERLRLIDADSAESFRFPGTQQHLADALGMTHVHVSRTLARLQDDGIVIRRGFGDLQVQVTPLRAVVELGMPSDFLHCAVDAEAALAAISPAG